MARDDSPAASEAEIDIFDSLFKNPGPTGTTSKTSQKNGRKNEMESDMDDEAFVAATQAAAYRNGDRKPNKKAGSFQTMGLNPSLLSAISRKGFAEPTPIQRKTIPVILEGTDVVGMARTGSGKTAAFVVPMIEKLKSHSAKVGARAVVLSPSRELALQTLKVVRELCKGTDLRSILLVGGDSLEDQFGSVAGNPDIIIATPGRFEHLKVEMGLELSTVKYIVFDEADRLFEMGFAPQLTEIMHSLPATRQTLLFSATLPQSLVEFARAGLQDPKLVRLDTESKISSNLQSAFFTLNASEKEGALLHVLQDVIKMPVGEPTECNKTKNEEQSGGKKRKRGPLEKGPDGVPTLRSTIIFTATKHHVEYLAHFLRACGYATSHVYGSLDQTARKIQTQAFRNGQTNILVVTDVAARGLDIPVLANVINYDFPSQSKIFVHRVGRTARAGKTGWSYSLLTREDMPYLLDLQLFLSRELVTGRVNQVEGMFRNAIVVGTLLRDKLERSCEEVSKIIDHDDDLVSMRDVSKKGERQYVRTRNAASVESVKRAKALAQSGSLREANMLFAMDDDVEKARLDMLARVSTFKPQETVFEVGRRGAASAVAEAVQKRRAKLELSRTTKHEEQTMQTPPKVVQHQGHRPQVDVDVLDDDDDDDDHDDDASDEELELTVIEPAQTDSQHTKHWRDSEHFMGYTPIATNQVEDRGYSVHDGTNSRSNFTQAAQGATMDLVNDETKAFGEASRMRWDKKSKKYVSRANDEDGSKGKRMIRGESGQKMPASFRSGRFDAWRKANKIERLPRPGELEPANAKSLREGSHAHGRVFKHKMERAPKAADRFRDDYEKRKKRVNEARLKNVGRFDEGKGRGELRGVDDVRKARKVKQKRREKNARPSRKRA